VIWHLIPAPIKRAFAAVLAAFVAAFALVRYGRRKQQIKDALKDQEDYTQTRKAMDDADEIHGADPDAARRWLRERDKQ
jgi:hypothetical protein